MMFVELYLWGDRMIVMGSLVFIGRGLYIAVRV